ncbi:hypothetical protein [Cyclobacterium marinum]|uniref:HPt domain-containing protein n=1 Tax=Cyclobacterium marinum (strain ATCC 25205 / DSM 745 / LMG 13164 / NCIMB 1802) TaxID=880070 RepID=G0IYY3_CYCMS|nr:hypothetical protein [Cyclobacterium marinum]AEL28128.1 hypothetical protein Cycma_4426 [Cyclobacterium marinum DSM 745]
MYKQIKPDMIYHYFDEDIELIHEIIELVLELNVQDLKTLLPLYETGQLSAIKKKFHRSKPIFSLLGANLVNKKINALEKEITNNFSDIYPDFLKTLDELEQDLHFFLKSTPH